MRALALLLVLLPAVASNAAEIAVVPLRCHSVPGAGPSPVIVLLHGADGYEKLAAQYDSHVAVLAPLGFRVCAIHYYSPEDAAVMGGADRAARQALYERRFSAWLAAVNGSIDYLAKLPATRGGSVGVLGFSQGAYLGVAAAGTNRAVKAVVSFYGGVPSLAAQEIDRLPPLLIVHGKADFIVPVEAAQLLAEFAKSKGGRYAIRLYDDAGHGFDGRLEDASSIDAHRVTAEFFERHLAGR